MVNNHRAKIVVGAIPDLEDDGIFLASRGDR
jgi:hypothetical protein